MVCWAASKMTCDDPHLLALCPCVSPSVNVDWTNYLLLTSKIMMAVSSEIGVGQSL